jgi:cytochrome c553
VTRTRFLCRLGAALALWAASRVGLAQEAPPAALDLQGDAARGKVLGYTCLGCHGIDGYKNASPVYHVPKLGGQSADYLEIALQGYRRGTRRHATMQAQAAPLADQDIADLAAYFASREGEPEAGVGRATPETIAAGQQKSVACVPCHGAGGMADAPQWPSLAGQHASYLRQALEQYRSGARADLLMGPMIGTLDESALEELAAFYSTQPGLHTTEH